MARQRKPPQTSTLPASLILTLREEKYFRRYQRTNATVPAEQQGLLPTASEYLAFQCWYKQRDSGYFSDTSLGTLATYLEKKDQERNTAKLCNHPLHPSHGKEHTSCPPCIVEMYMRYVDLLKENLTNGDGNGSGTVQQRWEPTNDDPIVMAWRKGKVHLLRAVATIEKWAISEHAWEQRHAEASTDNTKTAKQALRMYHAAVENSCALPMRSAGSETSSASCMSSTSSVDSADAKPRRSVSFVEETSFTLGRPPQYFCRRSPRYEAGKYAFAVESDGDDEEDGEDDEEEEEDSTDEEDDHEDEPIAATTNTPIAATKENSQGETIVPLNKVIPSNNDTIRDTDTTNADEQSDGPDESDSDADSETDSDAGEDQASDEDEDDDDDDEEEEVNDTDFAIFEETSFVVFAN